MTALTAADLADVPAGPRTVRVYLRHCYLPATGPADPLWVSAGVESRWWTPAGTLYVAEDADTVMAEHCRNNAAAVAGADPTGGVGLTAANLAYFAPRPVGAPLLARALYSVEVAFDRLADLRSPDALAALGVLGVSADDLLADDYGPCPALAQAGEQLGWQAVRASSAANPDGSALGIFAAARPAPALWHEQLAAARPSVRTAYLTRYRAGERPAWLTP